MKKIIILVIFSFLFVGCGKSHHTVVVDPGEKIELTESIKLQCDEPFKITATGQGESNVTVEYPGIDATEYNSQIGLDVEYNVVTECVTNPVVKPVEPVDGECPTDYLLNEDTGLCDPAIEKPEVPVPDCSGNCPEGYKKTDCNTCVAVPCPKCGEGTELDDNNTCVAIPEVIEPVECDEGFRAVDNKCMAIRYVPFKTTDCMDGYKFRKKLNICKLQIEEL